MKKILITLIIIYLLFTSNIYAEIQQVSLRFRAGLCNDQCGRFVTQHLYKIPGVQNVQMMGRNDAAVMQYNTNQPFSWFTFDRAMRSVGISIHEMQITVRGEIHTNGNSFILVSLGDGTPFNLLGPINIQPGKFMVPNNPASHQLNDQLRAELYNGMVQGKYAVIQGSLLMPWRNPIPVNLIIQQISWQK